MARDLKLQVALKGLNGLSKPFREAAKTTTGLGRDIKATRTELKGLQALQSDISSYKKQHAAVRETSESLARAQQRMREMREQLKGMTAPTDAFQKKFFNASKEVDRLSQKHQEQRAELRQTITRFKEAGVSTSTLKDREKALGGEIDAVNRKMKAQKDRLAALTRQQERLGRAKQQYDRTQGLAGSMAANGAGGLASGSGILYTMARTLLPGLEFDASMSKVQALSRLDKNSPELAALRGQARELGASTQFTAGQAADAQGFLAMAGFTPQAIRAAMPGMLSLAKAGDSDLAQTADIASNILGGFGLQATEMSRVGDVLTQAFTTSNTNLQMLGETMKYVGPVARASGMGLEEAAAMAGLLGNVGIQSSQAGTTLRAMLLRLAAPAGPAAKALKKLGVDAKDTEGNMRNVTSVLADVAKATERMGSGDRLEYLKAIFGEEPAAGMAELLNQSGTGGLTKYLQIVKNYEGAASRTAAVMADNLKGDLSELSSAWEDFGIELQTQQNGPLRGLTQGITRVIGSVKTWVSENPELASQLVKTAAGLGLVMAGMGGLTLAMASILGPFALVRYGLGTVAVYARSLGSVGMFLGRTALPLVGKGILLIGRALMLNPIGLAVTAIAAAAYLIYKNWEPIKAFFTDIWGQARAAFDQGIGGISKLLLNWSPLGLLHSSFATAMSYLGVEIPTKFTEFGGMMMQGLVNGIKNAAGAVKDAVVSTASDSIDFFKERLGIHSPSRVFAELGGFTMQGLAQGLDKGQASPLRTMGNIAASLVAAGGMSIGAGPAIAMDNRAPLAPIGGGQSIVVQGDTLHITLGAGSAQDLASLRRLFNQLLDERERGKAARIRAALHDTE